MDILIIIKPNYNRSKKLLESFAHRIFYPVIVGVYREKEYLIDGYLRYRFTNNSTIHLTKIYYNTLEEIILDIISINTSIRELHLIERAFLIVFAVEHGLQVDLTTALGIKVDDEVIAQARRITTLPPSYLHILQEQKVLFKHLGPLFYFDNEQLKELEPILIACQFSQSNFYEFLQNVHHFITAYHTNLYQLFTRQDILTIINDPLHSSHQKGEDLLEYFNHSLKPQYYQSVDKLNRWKIQLKSQADIELIYNPNFEDDYYKLSFTIANQQDIDLIEKIVEVNRKNFMKILEIIHGED